MTAHFTRIEAGDTVRMLDTLDALRADAGGALERTVQASPYDRIDWLNVTARHLWSEASLAVATAHRGHEALWLPLRDSGAGHGRGFASWYTLAFAPVFTPGCSARDRATLLGDVARMLRGRFATINLWPLEPEVATALHCAFSANGWLARDVFEAAHWVAHTKGLDFDAYWAARPSRLRNTVRRKAKRSPVETSVFDRFDADIWSEYDAIYAASWKPAEGSAAFLRGFAEQESAAGTLRIGIARREGMPVAAQLWTVENGVATIHKLAHLESEREHSPGTLLSQAMFRHILDRDRPAMIDYGNGDEPYKAEWMDERRERRRLELFNLHSASGLSRAVSRAWRGAIRRIAR